MTLPDGFADGQSVQALDENQQILTKHGYGVVSGCAVSIYNGTLGSGEATVEVAAGTLLVDESTVDVASTTLSIGTSDVDPRKDLVVYDTGASALAVVEGQAEDANPADAVRQQAEVPTPPSLESSVTAVSGSGDPKIPLAEAWIPADADSITSDDLFDRRQSAYQTTDSLSTNSLNGGVTGDVELSDITGPNLFINSGNLSTSNMRTDVQDDGTEIVSNTTTLNFGTNLSVTDSSGVAVIDASGSSGTTTITYMSDYTSGGVADSAFDTAVSDTPAGQTLMIDVDIELTAGHTISKPITVDSTDSVTVTCSNTSNNNAHILFQGGGTGNSTTTTEIANVGERTIGVNDTSIFAAGDRVLFMNATYSQTVNAQIQFAEIESVDGTNGTITLMSAISKEFASGVDVYVVDLLDSPKIKNLNTDGGGWRHLQFRWCENPVFDNVSISEYLEVSLYTLDSWKPRYYNVEATEPEGLLSGEGEPIVSYRCTDGLIESPRVYDCRRGIDFAWGARNFTIIDPILHGCVIGGITVHQDDQAGTFSIQGGEIVCQSTVPDSSHNGHGISMSSSAVTFVEGTKITARVNGLLCSGETHATNCVIQPSDGTTEGNAGIYVRHSDCSIQGCVVNDPDGQFDQGVWVDGAAGALENIVVDTDMDFGAENMIYVDGRSNAVKNVRIRGNFDLVGSTSNQGFIVEADDSNRVENIDISVTVENHPEQAIRLQASATNSAGVLDNVDIHDCYFDCAQAAVYSNGTGTFETMRVRDSSMDTGSTSISFNETINKLFITNNDVSGSIDSTGATNSTVTGNL